MKFEGELNPAELEFVLGIGLNILYQQGMLPFNREDDEQEEVH